ncbi:hypothetical protein OEZ85_007744 [Tetradesmus obliquus]|uniref:Uncharacterized protein n=1 Tax=Tetradesmus obliquus TaxID=3088 RepID=A0ABY8TJ21_TETOB|nr:hypothetical protein OEZ85_007744 [Tetradesmus obliquus]
MEPCCFISSCAAQDEEGSFVLERPGTAIASSRYFKGRATIQSGTWATKQWRHTRNSLQRRAAPQRHASSNASN